jgi:hypothetical protein
MLGCRVFFAQHRFQKRICSAFRARSASCRTGYHARSGGVFFERGSAWGLLSDLPRACSIAPRSTAVRSPARQRRKPAVCERSHRLLVRATTRRHLRHPPPKSTHARTHTPTQPGTHTRTADTHNRTHTQTRTNTQTRTHAHTFEHTQTHARARASTDAHDHARTSTHARMHAHDHARTHARARPRTHACTHTHARTHARAARFQVPAALRRAHGMAIHIGRHASVAHAAHVSSHTCADARTCAAHLQSIAHTCRLTTPHTTQNKKRAAIRRSHRTARRSASQWHGLTID